MICRQRRYTQYGFLLLAASSFLGAAASYAEPICELSEETAEVKCLKGTPTVTHVYTITNTGSEPLQIFEKAKSCGCVNVVAPRTVPAGQNGTIALTAEVKSPSGGVTVRIGTNSPARPELILELRYKVVQPLAIQPESIALGQVVPGKAKTFEAEIVSTDNPQDFSILGVKAASGMLQVEEPKSFPSEPAQKVRLRFKIIPREGQIRDEILVRTNKADMPVVVLPVSGMAIGNFRATPTQLLFGVCSPDTPKQKAATIASVDGALFSVVNVSTEIMKVDVKPAGKVERRDDATFSDKWTVNVETASTTRTGVWKDLCKLKLKLLDNTETEFALDCVGTFMANTGATK